MTSMLSNNKQNINPKQDFYIDSPDFLYSIITNVIQELLESEMSEFLGAERHQRNFSRRGHRSRTSP